MPVHHWKRVLPGICHDFRTRWVGAIRDRLNDGLLPPDYYALAEQVAGGPQPDVVALQNSVSETKSAWGHPACGVLAMLDHPPAVKYTEVLDEARGIASP